MMAPLGMVQDQPAQVLVVLANKAAIRIVFIFAVLLFGIYLMQRNNYRLPSKYPPFGGYPYGLENFRINLYPLTGLA